MDEIYEFMIKVGENFLGVAIFCGFIYGASYILTRYFKFFAYLFIIIVVFPIIWSEFFDRRPFKFEEYCSSEELEQALKEHFPMGFDVNEAVKILEESGAVCKIFEYNKDNEIMYDLEERKKPRDDYTEIPKRRYDYTELAFCKYTSGILPLPDAFEVHRITIYGNVHRKVMNFFTVRMKGFYY